MVWLLLSALACRTGGEAQAPPPVLRQPGEEAPAPPPVLRQPGEALFLETAAAAGLGEGREHAGGWIFSTGPSGYQLSMQHFAAEQTVYIAVNDYHWLDRSRDHRTTAFTLTQMAVQNHAMIGGKLQLNPANGAITLGTEIPAPNGVDPEALGQAVRRLLVLAEDNHAMLGAALGGDGY